jgi:hypothetical protein
MTAVRMEVSALEAAHLTDLVLQFTDLLADHRSHRRSGDRTPRSRWLP